MGEALVIVDFQNDFCPGGALAVPDGDAIADRVDELAGSGRFDLVVATRDWHPLQHGSFEAQGGPWPPHCVQETDGAAFHPSLDPEKVQVVISKGVRSDTEGYSGFEDTELDQVLRENGIDSVTLVGLATDYCVHATALDALRRGLGVTIDLRGTRGIDPAAVERAVEELRAEGASLA